jgi:hypothetical protein
MYHVTQTGEPYQGGSIEYDYSPAVYLFDDERDAQQWQQSAGGQIISVSVEGIPLKWDAGTSLAGWGNYWRYEGDPSALRRTSSDLFADWLSAALLPEVRGITFERLAAMQHEAQWSDVASKAKRLVQSAAVTILRNAPHHVMSHVRGDHGEYNCEISRHDPNSQIIEQWNCECPWAQFAFDRTRKWKKLEGRVCSHVLATYWKAKGTPLDIEGQEPGFQTPQGQMPGAQPGQETIQGPTGPKGEPEVFTPAEDQGLVEQGPPEAGPTGPEGPAPQALPSNQDLTIPKAPKSPFEQQKKTPPQKQYEQLHLFDITAPPGMQPTPAAPPVSVPGGRPPTPGNPVQFPGTFSHFIPMMTLRTSNFIMYTSDAMTDFFETQRAAHKPIIVALKTVVALEQSGGKMPVPGAQPYDTTSEGIPLYRVMDLGWNPDTGVREKADVNALQGAPEQQGTYADVPVGKQAEVIDFDPTLKMAYINVPLNYPDGGDVRLHPHSLKGWVDYADLRPVPNARNIFR